MLSLICAWVNGWINNRDAGDLKRHRAHHDANAMRKGEIHIYGKWKHLLQTSKELFERWKKNRNWNVWVVTHISNYLNIHLRKKEKLFSIISKLQATVFRIDLKKWTDIQGLTLWSTAPDTVRTTGHKAWNTPLENLNWECKNDIRELYSNEFDPVFSKKVRRQKYHWGDSLVVVVADSLV